MRIVSIACGILLIVVFAFGAGMWATNKNWLPWQMMVEWRDAAKSFKHTGQILRAGSYTRRPPDSNEGAYIAHKPEAMAPGQLLVVKLIYPGDRFDAELLDQDGTVLHRWKLDYSLAQSDGYAGEYIHAIEPMPDGSVIVTFDEAYALARFDACGDLMWARTDRNYHHSLHKDEKGGFWTWQSTVWVGSHDQNMVRFDPETGEIVEKIDMIDDVMAGNPEAELTLTFPEAFKFNRDLPKKTNVDFLHPNDAEPLTAEMADAFPMFEEGDLLVSLRNINALAVIDRETHEINWIRYGPWRDQHDADFQPDGTISVFSNNRDRRRSTLLEIDMATDEVRDVFWGTGLYWHSYIMGKHEKLPNGNWLIVSAVQGRVIEVTPEGELVREINNMVTEDFNAVLPNAKLIPTDFFNGLPSCNRS